MNTPISTIIKKNRSSKRVPSDLQVFIRNIIIIAYYCVIDWKIINQNFLKIKLIRYNSVATRGDGFFLKKRCGAQEFVFLNKNTARSDIEGLEVNFETKLGTNYQ